MLAPRRSLSSWRSTKSTSPTPCRNVSRSSWRTTASWQDWGGDTVTVEVSAKQHKNLDLLLEMILLVADLQQLKANPKRLATGAVIESRLDRGRGPVASILVQNGTLNVGDAFIVGAIYGKVRAMFD